MSEIGGWGVLKRLVKAVPGGKHLVTIYRFIRGGDARYASLWRRHIPGLFQPCATTQPDRYPALFRFVLNILGERPDIRLLSFGCATGEEVFSLRCYFPRAFIRGVDINPRNIAVCRAKLIRRPDTRISFNRAATVLEEAISSYDAIFAMAVYRHGDLGGFPTDCGHLLRFNDFEQSVTELAACLKPGGLLVLRHANFRFVDTLAAHGFELLLQVPQHPESPVYDRNERLLVPQPHLEGAVFRKQGD